MSEYAKLAEEFFQHYERPQIDKLTVGFTGIDPQKRIFEYELDHEGLNNLQGGDNSGHYHLTKKQFTDLITLLNEHFSDVEYELTEYDGGDSAVMMSEYFANMDLWLDGGYSPANHEKDYDGGDSSKWQNT